MTNDDRIRAAELLVIGGHKVKHACREAGITVSSFYRRSRVRRRDLIRQAITRVAGKKGRSTYREIAAEAGLPVATVWRWLKRQTGGGNGR